MKNITFLTWGNRILNRVFMAAKAIILVACVGYTHASDLKLTPDTGVDYARDPQIATSRDNTYGEKYVYATWNMKDEGASYSRIVLRRSTNYGDSFNPLQQPISGVADHRTPQIACASDGRHVYMAWLMRDSLDYDTVRFMRSDDYGASWEYPSSGHRLGITSDSTGKMKGCQVLCGGDNGNVIVLWIEDDTDSPADTKIRYRLSTDHGDHFGDEGTLPIMPVMWKDIDDIFASSDGDMERIVVAAKGYWWSQQIERVLVWQSGDSGVSWTTHVEINDTNGPVELSGLSNIARDPGGSGDQYAFVSYGDKSLPGSSNYIPCCARLKDDQTVEGPRILDINGTHKDSRDVSVCSNGGNKVYVAWYRKPVADYDCVHLAKCSNATGAFTFPPDDISLLNTDGANVAQPYNCALDIGCDSGGRPYAIWHDERATTNKIRGNYLGVNGVSPLTDETGGDIEFSSSVGAHHAPVLKTGGTNIYAMWERRDGLDRKHIYFNALICPIDALTHAVYQNGNFPRGPGAAQMYFFGTDNAVTGPPSSRAQYRIKVGLSAVGIGTHGRFQDVAFQTDDNSSQRIIEVVDDPDAVGARGYINRVAGAGDFNNSRFSNDTHGGVTEGDSERLAVAVSNYYLLSSRDGMDMDNDGKIDVVDAVIVQAIANGWLLSP